MKAQLKCGFLSVAVLSVSALFGLAACSSSAQAVDVSGTEACTAAAAVPAGADFAFDCTDTMSDDRVSGTGQASGTASSDGTTTAGTYTLTNGNGTWTGDWTGIVKDGQDIIDGVMTGSGDYAGWTYTFHLESTVSSSTELNANLTGTLQPPS